MNEQMKNFLHRSIGYSYKSYMISVALVLSILFVLSPSRAEDAISSTAVHRALEEIRQNISISRERITFLTNQVELLKKDQQALIDALIKGAQIERIIANDVAKREEKLKKMVEKQEQMRRNLNSCKAEFAEVLAILERMGLNPPPALMARPEDVLSSMRSSVLLGAVIPEMQEKIKALAVSLKELTNISNSITTEYASLKVKIRNQAEQRKHLELLLKEKSKLQKISEKELMEQRQKSISLIKKVKSLEELVLELDRQSQINSNVSMRVRKNLQLLEQRNFENQKGSLLFPVSGKRVGRVSNSSQVIRFGEVIETEPEAVVIAPANALVAFAGPFRSYGQLIILNVGSGYHIVLIGMSKINVIQGQFVLSGEPLGTMGTQFIANSVTLDIGKSAPMLYIEFRKQGKPVNPIPWWRTEKSRRNQNDS
ncbi:murein hydrolase activator EnvC family protein [Bartonella sp. B41]